MHEFSICQSIIDTVIKETENQELDNCRLLKVRLIVGQLRQLVSEYLIFAFNVLAKGTIAEGASLEIKNLATAILCLDCSYKGETAKDTIICPKCHSVQVDIINGKELLIESIEVDDNE